MSNPFAGLNQATTSKSGQYLKPGEYELEIQKCVYIDNENVRAFIAEMVVTASSNPDVPVGSARSWFQKVNKSFKPEVKAFCYAATGYDENNPEHEKIIREAIDHRSEAIMNKALTHNILRGRKVHASVFDKQQKEDKSKTFTKHVWSPGKDTTPLAVALLDKAIALQ